LFEIKCKNGQPKLVSIQILGLVFNPEFIKENKKKSERRLEEIV
jgi:hypothetical protein